MKKIITALLLIFAIATCLHAQPPGFFNEEIKKETIERAGALLEEHYVFADLGKVMKEELLKNFQEGKYNEYKDAGSFAESLTKDLQAISKDKHLRLKPIASKMRIMHSEAGQEPGPHGPPLALRPTGDVGFKEVKKLEGNIGYLDLRMFAPAVEGKPVADAYMKLLESSDAIIIDLRKNGGGDPFMVQYLCSYFFDKKVHLNSIYWRKRNETNEFWTLDKIGGNLMPEVPLFILTSNFTFSAAEEFAYDMKAQKRATIIGETTGGGANPGGPKLINPVFEIFIPEGRAINPVTGTNWEGVGVEPEIKISSEDALAKAIELAGKSAEDFRHKKDNKSRKILGDLTSALNNTGTNGSAKTEEAIYAILERGIKESILNEAAINNMGYSFLGRREAGKAEIVLKINTLMFPTSANTYDSYAEALAANNKKAEALKQYQKAVEVATLHKSADLELFQRNLKQHKQEMKK
jgi:hypothetical protein